MDTSGRLRLAYFGDDFTGSTDALESLSRAGLRTILFTEPPAAAQLDAFAGAEAVGVAGLTRSLPPREMRAQLEPALAALRGLGAPHVHYKVCSTFDSSPAVGSIGCAIDVGAQIFGREFVPLVVGAPALGRYCVFGNLFARMGIGSAGRIHRLDRHPAMSRHPVTPADESDLRLHLARQTGKRIGLVDVLQVARPAAEARAALEAEIAAGAEIVLFDALTADHLARIGGLLDERASAGRPLFSVGSSAIGMALGAHWAATGEAAGPALTPRTDWPDPGEAGPLLIVSGSCSPVTVQQIEWAAARGFQAFAFHPGGGGSRETVAAAAAALAAGRPAIVHSHRGESLARTIPAAELGGQLGRVARELLGRTGVRRLVIAGGDTSSHAARALGIQVLEMMAPLAPGAPLCRAHAPGSPADRLEVNFKGGQVGASDYFGAVARGRI